LAPGNVQKKFYSELPLVFAHKNEAAAGQRQNVEQKGHQQTRFQLGVMGLLACLKVIIEL